MEIKVVKNILEANEVIASQNRTLFTEKGIYVVNLMGSPGAGKTTLLERTINHLKDTERIAVIEGDIATSRDAERIAAHAIPTVQINTGAACHLDGNMVKGGLKELDLDQIDLLPYLDFDMEAFHSDALKVNPRLKVMAISCKTGEGLDTWFSWIEERAGKKGS